MGQLEKVWEIHTGDIADDKLGKEDQNTPLFAAGKLFQCSPSCRVTAVDPATGKMVWQFDPKTTAPYWQRCRTLGFVPAREQNKDYGDRVVVATVDRRLIALRAEDGKVCESFGKGGTVDLSVGIGQIEPGRLMPTSGPNVAGDKIVLGAWVTDNISEGEPEGPGRLHHCLCVAQTISKVRRLMTQPAADECMARTPEPGSFKLLAGIYQAQAAIKT